MLELGRVGFSCGLYCGARFCAPGTKAAMGNTGGLFEQIISLEREKFFQSVAGNEFVK